MTTETGDQPPRIVRIADPRGGGQVVEHLHDLQQSLGHVASVSDVLQPDVEGGTRGQGLEDAVDKTCVACVDKTWHQC